MDCTNLIGFLCKLPGREVPIRLYRYSECLIDYLNGHTELFEKVLERKQSDDSFVENLYILQGEKKKIRTG